MDSILTLSPKELKKLQAVFMEMKQRAQEDPVYFFETFLYTFDPKREPYHLRFVPFDFQKRLIRSIIKAIEDGEDLFIEKCREMGATYTVLGVLIWMWLWRPAFNALIGSRKEDYVDNRRGGITGNKEESLFGKIDYMISRLPDFILPTGFTQEKHFNYMSLSNPENGNVISGESANPNFSRGSRRTVIVLDEFAFWDNDCFHKDTEVLTNSGWKLIKDCTTEDLVYSMDIETGKAKLMPVTKLHAVYAEYLYEFTSKAVHISCTANHKLLLKKRYTPNGARQFLNQHTEKSRSQQSVGTMYYRRADAVYTQNHDFIPLTSEYVGGDCPETIYGYDAKDFMEFLGWFISEGYASNVAGQRSIGISQDSIANPEKTKQIRELLTRMGLPVKYYTNSFQIRAGAFPKEMFEELCALGKAHEKYIPQSYLNLSKPLLRPLFDALIKGDGSRTKRTDRVDKLGYFTVSERLADNVQELAQKIGMKASIAKHEHKNSTWRNLYRVTIGFRQHAQVASLQKKRVPYHDVAYCVTTPYHSLYVRRNGVAAWCGNSSVWGATADTTNCRIVMTTPGIRPSKAKKLRFGKDGEKIKVITLPYSLDPRKDKKWLDEQRARRSVEDFNREIMVNWELSLTGRVYPEIDNASYGAFPLLLNTPVFYSWDFGLDGVSFGVWQHNTSNGRWRLVDSYHNHDKVIQFYLPFFGAPINSAFDYTDDDLKAIEQFKQYPKGIHFGDPDVKKRSLLTGTSTRQELEKIGVYVQCIDKNDFYIRREKTKVQLQQGLEINANPRNEYFYEAIKSARYPQREESSQATTPIALPVHDWCLAGETKIRTLNGWKEIKDLVGEEHIWVWSYSHIRKRLVPARASGCWLVGKNRPTILVGLDNGHTIRCTPNHPFMLRDGTYKDAEFLEKGDSLMPFYERNDGGYVDIQLNDGSHGPEHQLVYSEIKGMNNQDNHIHHIDGCTWHNSPDNLEEIDPANHCSRTFAGIPNGKRSKYVPPYQPYSSRSTVYRDCRYCGNEFVGNYKTYYCSKKCRKNKERMQTRDRARNDEQYRDLMKKVNRNYEERHQKECIDCGRKIHRKSTRCRDCYNGTYNHKVRFVVRDYKLRDVYDLEVPEHHNFVAEGVVTHNTSHPRTMMEYLFVNYDAFSNMQQEEPSWANKARTWLTHKTSIAKRRWR